MGVQPGTPEGQCGFVVEPEDVAQWFDVENNFEMESTQLRRKRNVLRKMDPTPCRRPVWETEEVETNRCVWHTEVEDKPINKLRATKGDGDGPHCLDGAFLANIEVGNQISFEECRLRFARFHQCVLNQVVFTDNDLYGATFIDSNLEDARFADNCDLEDATFTACKLRRTRFTNNCNLRRAKFTDSKLRSARFTDSKLSDVVFESCNCRGVEFTCEDWQETNRPSNLEDTVFKETDFREATFEDARLYQTIYTDVRINSAPTFDEQTDKRTIYEREELGDWAQKEVTQLEAAAWVHRRLESLHEENAMSEEASEFHIRKQEAERKYHEYDFTWFTMTLMRVFTNHGESLKRVLGWWGVVIVVCAFLYPIFGGFASSSPDSPANVTYSFVRWGWMNGVIEKALTVVPSDVLVFLESLYFSVITFTTIGYGDLYPVGAGAKVLVGIESLAGAVLIALFIYVLGRQVSR